MTLENLKDFFKDVSLKHKDVKTFLVGSYYDAANSGDDKYPLVFYELPYSVNYAESLTKRIDSVTFALNVFLYTRQDDIADDHQAISMAKEIGDAILSKIKQVAPPDFSIQNVNALSVREYTDDSVSGIRYDITVLLVREPCDSELDENFIEVIT